MHRMRRGLTTVIVFSVMVLGLAGCAALGGSQNGQQGGDVPSVSGGGSAEEPATDGSAEKAPDSAVVTTGRMLLTVADPIAAADHAAKIAVDAGGRVDSRKEYAGDQSGNGAQAELVLRIPAEDLDEARAELTELGTLAETSFSADEVGTVQRDLDARIKTLQTSIARYTAWLATAQKTSDLIELEQAISERQTELESLQAQKRDLDDRVDLATVTVTLASDYVPLPQSPRNLGEAVAAGWTAFLGFWTAAGIAVAFVLPWLLLLALIAAVVVWLARRGRRTAPAPTMAPPAPSPPPVPPAGPEAAQAPDRLASVPAEPTPPDAASAGGQDAPAQHDAPR